jgi:hypothetical protein
VINLERRTDRLSSINLPFEYNVFKATDGKKPCPDHTGKISRVFRVFR